MKYQILHETANSLRVRRIGRGFSMEEAESLKAQLADDEANCRSLIHRLEPVSREINI